MSTENHMKLSKRFGLNLRPFKKVTPKQQKIMQKVQKQQALKKKSNFGVQLEIKKSVAFLYGGLRAKYLTTSWPFGILSALLALVQITTF